MISYENTGLCQPRWDSVTSMMRGISTEKWTCGLMYVLSHHNKLISFYPAFRNVISIMWCRSRSFLREYFTASAMRMKTSCSYLFFYPYSFKLFTIFRAFDGTVPPHFYGEMAKTELGCQILQEKGHFTEFSQFIRQHSQESEDTELIMKLKSILWAVVRQSSVDTLGVSFTGCRATLAQRREGYPFWKKRKSYLRFWTSRRIHLFRQYEGM